MNKLLRGKRLLTDMGSAYPAFLTPFGVGILALAYLWQGNRLSGSTADVWKTVIPHLKYPQQSALVDILENLNVYDRRLLLEELQLIQTVDALFNLCIGSKSNLGAKSLLGRFAQEWSACVEMTDFDHLVDFLERFWTERDSNFEKRTPSLVSALKENDVARASTLLHEHYDHYSRSDESAAYPPPRALAELAGMHDKWGHPKAAMTYLEQAMKQARAVDERTTSLKAALSAYMLREPLCKTLGTKDDLLNFLTANEVPEIAEELAEIRVSEGSPQSIEAHLKMLPKINDKGHYHMTQAEAWFQRGKASLASAHIRLAEPFAESSQQVRLRLNYLRGVGFHDLEVKAEEDLGLLLDAQRLAAQGSFEVARHILGLIKDPAAIEDVLRLEFEMLLDEDYPSEALKKAKEMELLAEQKGSQHLSLQCSLKRAQALSALGSHLDEIESQEIAERVSNEANRRGWTPLVIQAALLLTRDYAPLVPCAAACSKRLAAEVSVLYALHGGPIEPAVAIARDWPDLSRRLSRSEPSSPAGWKRQLETPEMPKKRRGYEVH